MRRGLCFVVRFTCEVEVASAFDKMMELTGGHIDVFINNAGMGIGLPYQGAYSASKFAIEGYCEALRLELRKSGVSVTVIEPEYLASVICRIVEKKKPAYSYVVATFLQKLSIFAKWLLPAPAFGWILSLYYKL